MEAASDRGAPEPPAELMAAMARLCPEVERDLTAFWDKPVSAYAAHLFRSVQPPRSPIAVAARGILRSRLQIRAGSILPSEKVAAVMTAFDSTAVVQAGVHSQLLLDPISFNAFLLGWLGAVEARLPGFFVFTGTTVTMETVGKEGPGWLDLGDRQINLFGMGRHKLCRQSVCGAGPVTLNQAALEEAAPHFESAGWPDVLLAQAGRSLGNAADAMAELNGRLVAHWDDVEAAPPVFFDDRHAALVLAQHLEDPDGLLTRLLTDPVRRARLDAALAEAATGPYGRFLPDGTTHFWGVREKRVRKLAVVAGRLMEPERPHGVIVPLERDALRDALLTGRLLPNLFLLFMVMAILPRVRVLGGLRQIGYVPVYQSVLLEVLDRSRADESELAAELTTCESAWGMRVIEGPGPIREAPENAAPGRLLDRLRKRYSDVSLAEATDSLRLLRESGRWRRLMPREASSI